MIHFVFSRAFRDSLLGNGLPIGTLPGLILTGTVLALILSLLLSWLFDSGRLSHQRLGGAVSGLWAYDATIGLRGVLHFSLSIDRNRIVSSVDAGKRLDQQ